jgi:hypothetical protein
VVKVPAFLLKRLYVKGSLKNIAGGFQFELKNTLGSGYGKQLLPLVVDGKELPLETTYFKLDHDETAFSDVSQGTPFTLPLNRTLFIIARGDSLAEGPHKVALNFVVEGLGQLGFEVTDLVSNP